MSRYHFCVAHINNKTNISLVTKQLKKYFFWRFKKTKYMDYYDYGTGCLVIISDIDSSLLTQERITSQNALAISFILTLYASVSTDTGVAFKAQQELINFKQKKFKNFTRYLV